MFMIQLIQLIRDYLENQIKRFDRYSDALEQVYKIYRESNPSWNYIDINPLSLLISKVRN